MKTITFTIILSVAFGLISVQNSFARALTIDKVLADKTFEVNPDALLFVDHEYGSVNCRNWDKNSISVKLTVHIESKNEDQAQKIIDRIQFDISGDKNKVSSVCKLGSGSFGSNSAEFSIDMEIFMPKTISFQLKHKFGSAYVEIIEGETKIKSEYGSMKALSLLNPSCNIDLAFGSAEIQAMTNGTLGVEYSKLTLGTGKVITFDTKYSDLTIESLENGSFTIEGGSLDIENLNRMNISSKFSNIDVNVLQSELQATVEYGNLNINFVKTGFANLSIENSFGNVNLKIDKTATYNVSVVTEFGGFSYPESLASFTSKIVKSTSSSYSGVIGKGNNTGSNLIGNSSYGHINLEAK